MIRRIGTILALLVLASTLAAMTVENVTGVWGRSDGEGWSEIPNLPLGPTPKNVGISNDNPWRTGGAWVRIKRKGEFVFSEPIYLPHGGGFSFYPPLVDGDVIEARDAPVGQDGKKSGGSWTVSPV